MAYSHGLEDDESTWPGEVFLSEDELGHYVDDFSRSGFGGPLSWYRSIEATWRVQKDLYPNGVVPKIPVPALMIAARRDAICHPDRTDNLLQYVENLERRMIDTGHWTQQEDPEGTNRLMIDWLNRHF
jgi:pimeloyl-ACP methyl ester carboxylesterase